MLIPGEDLFPEPGKVLPVGPLPVVAPPAQTAHIYRGRTAAAEKHPLPQAGAPGSHFPSVPRFAFPAPGGDAGRILRGFRRHKPVIIVQKAVRNPERSSWDGPNRRWNVARSHSVAFGIIWRRVSELFGARPDVKGLSCAWEATPVRSKLKSLKTFKSF